MNWAEEIRAALNWVCVFQVTLVSALSLFVIGKYFRDERFRRHILPLTISHMIFTARGAFVIQTGGVKETYWIVLIVFAFILTTYGIWNIIWHGGRLNQTRKPLR